MKNKNKEKFNPKLKRSIIDVDKMANQIMLSNKQDNENFKCCFCEGLGHENNVCMKCAERISIFVAENWEEVLKDSDKTEILEKVRGEYKFTFMDKLNFHIGQLYFKK